MLIQQMQSKLGVNRPETLEHYRAALTGLLSIVSLFLLSSCGAQPEQNAQQSDSEPAAAHSSLAAGFSTPRLHANIKALSSDEFEGRQPSSVGERKTIEHLRDQFSALGLEPGNGDSWYQAVDLVSIESDPSMALSVINTAQADASPDILSYGEEFVGWTKRVEATSSLANSELVFVGYGIVAPEYQWNDYAGLDMRGKTAVILVNDPGYATQDPEVFKGNAMTYYGRWTYKYAEAARQGAAGAIIVHEDGAAGYPWEVVAGSWSGPQFDLYTEDKNMSRVQVEGWITLGAAERLFKAAGQSYAALKNAARSGSFKAQNLTLNASTEFSNSLQRSESNNVLAKIAGSKRPGETVIYTAHWDHLGKREGDGDQIYNGAVDNATGTAALIELAAAFKELDTPPERTILFLAVTAEESGLLGSRFYTDNPVYELGKTVAALNIDAANVLGRTKDITVVGYGASQLDDYLRVAADGQGRVLKPEPTPEKGYYYRSDHFNFARQGVPALYAEGGVNYRGRSDGWGLAAQAEYTEKNYHKPGDEYDPGWDLSGMLEDLGLYFAIGYKLANEGRFPAWSTDSEFRAVREKARAKYLQPIK